MLQSNEKRKLTICGTSEYMPPEMLFDEDYSFSVDIFSFGMVIFEVRRMNPMKLLCFRSDHLYYLTTFSQILTRHKIGENNLLVRKPKEK